jgi:hypothetical protein
MVDDARPHVLSKRDGEAQPTRPRRLKWHHIYYLLAAFDLATISFSLFLNHQILSIYTESVALNQEWTERIGSYADLAQLVAAVNAPGNDVFDTQDVERESTRLDTAMREFDRALRAARTDLATSVEEAVAIPLAGSLGSVDGATDEMNREARLIFGYFEHGEPEMAGRRMAEMDRTYGHVRAALDELQQQVLAQLEHFRG